MSKKFYSGAVVRRSLIHFMTGKLLTGFIGLGILVLLVRMLPREQYGAYIVLTGLFEVLHVSSNLGVVSTAFRYIPELRIRGSAWGLYLLSRQLLVKRTLTLMAVSVLMVLAGDHIAQWAGMPILRPVLRLYGLVLVFEGLARFTDVLFDSLLLQGFSQVSVLIRNGIRFLGLLAFKFGLIDFMSFDLIVWTSIEAMASLIGATCSVWMYMSNVRVAPGVPRSEGDDLDHDRMRRYAIPSYFAQVANLAMGADVVKLLAARISDAIQTGAFGFAAALNAMIQRYLPAFLLIGMVRPLFVSARENGRSNEEMVGYATLIFKLNLFVIAPILALMMVMREPIAIWLSGGRFPEAGPYLILMIVLVVVRVAGQGMQLLLLITEQGRAGLLGSCVGMLGVAGGLLASPAFGVMALCCGLIVGEALNATVAQLALRRYHMWFRYDIPAAIKMLGAGAVSAGAVMFARQYLKGTGGHDIVMFGLLAATVYLLVCLVLRPFREHERALINRALPVPIFRW